jgi:hypothetical protein
METKKVRSVRFNDNALETISIIYPTIEEQADCFNGAPNFDPTCNIDDEYNYCRYFFQKMYQESENDFKRSGGLSSIYDKLSGDFAPTRCINRKKRESDLDNSNHVRLVSTKVKERGFFHIDNLDTNHHERCQEGHVMCF